MELLAGGKLRLDEPAPHVARLTLDNPAKRDALDHDILDALAELLPRLQARCLIVTGEGPVFSAGYDIGALPADELAEGGRGDRRPPVHRGHRRARRVPVPRRRGHRRSPGAGDLLRSPGLQRAAKLGMPPARLALVYSHTGLSVPTCIGSGRAIRRDSSLRQ